MEIVLHFDPTFDCVFLINGNFFEHAEIKVKSAEIIYVTVLPLNSALLPYTIKLLGAKALSNAELCPSYRLEKGRYYIKLLERYNYIYTTKKEREFSAASSAAKLFKFVMQKNYGDARRLMTEELSSGIDNNSLDAFFSDFVDIVENKRYVAAPYGSFFLITAEGNGTLYMFENKNGLIDNIYEYGNSTP